jgi:hypothetical protein
MTSTPSKWWVWTAHGWTSGRYVMRSPFARRTPGRSPRPFRPVGAAVPQGARLRALQCATAHRHSRTFTATPTSAPGRNHPCGRVRAQGRAGRGSVDRRPAGGACRPLACHGRTSPSRALAALASLRDIGLPWTASLHGRGWTPQGGGGQRPATPRGRANRAPAAGDHHARLHPAHAADWDMGRRRRLVLPGLNPASDGSRPVHRACCAGSAAHFLAGRPTLWEALRRR